MQIARRRWAWLLTGASGFAGLGYQVVWTQQHALWLGHEAAAVLAVVSAFFGGLAVGAGLLAARILRSPHPARWYAGCELLIALWSGVLALGLAPLSGSLQALIGASPRPAWQWTVAFAVTFVALLPATAAIGATLPALDRLLARLQGGASPLAGLYASNTLGAVVGALATAFWLVPGLGLLRTVAVCAAVNLACAAGALALAHGAGPLQPSPAVPVAPAVDSTGLLWRLAATGLLGIGYEVLVVRALSQVAENTVYTFAILLAVYLVGSALGAAAWQRWGSRRPASARQRDGLLGALAAAVLLGAASLWWALPLQQAVQLSLGPGMANALAAETLLAVAAFGLPTLLMGALFSQLSLQARAAGIAWGRCLAVNTLGAAAAPALFGVLLLPLLGLKGGLLLIAAAYLALVGLQAWRRPGALATVTALAAAALWAPPLQQVDVPEGGHIVSYREGAMAAVSVVEDAAGVSRLRIDNRQQEGSSASSMVDARQALLPVLLHPAPRHALFLGLGTGMTAAAAAGDTELQVEAVELLPEVIAASSTFTQALDDGTPNPRLHLSAGDARRFVRASSLHYDVIVSDNFHPARSGSAALYTVEHFRAVRGRLAPAGVFCQWLPLLLHPAPRRALFLGLGTGVTATSAALDPSLQVDAAELLPEVIKASAHFTAPLTEGSAGPRLHPVAADARRFVRAGGQPYDLIISDNFHPARSGSGALYTVEHFQAVRGRLGAQGLFCQWLPLHQLDLATLRSIVRSFQVAFPGGWALLSTHSLETPVLGLLARADSSRMDLPALRQRLARNTLPQRLADFGIPDEVALLGGFVAGPAALTRFAGDAPLNTDDHPVVAYAAPRITYAPDSLPRDRLLALLAQLSLTPDELLTPGGDATQAARLAAYWRARDLFISAGRSVRPSADVRAMLAQVQAPLLDVLRASPDFRPAYDPLLRMAQALARQDPAGARSLLQALARLQPARPEAAQALQQLGPP